MTICVGKALGHVPLRAAALLADGACLGYWEGDLPLTENLS